MAGSAQVAGVQPRRSGRRNRIATINTRPRAKPPIQSLRAAFCEVTIGQPAVDERVWCANDPSQACLAALSNELPTMYRFRSEC